jgi:hypothetical protein
VTDYAAKLRARLGEDLRAARKARDRPAIDTCRSLMAALDNAGAVPLDESAPRCPAPGPAEVGRRELSSADVTALLRREAQERTAAADEYERYGRPLEAVGLRAGAAVIERLIAAWNGEHPYARE